MRCKRPTQRQDDDNDDGKINQRTTPKKAAKSIESACCHCFVRQLIVVLFLLGRKRMTARPDGHAAKKVSNWGVVCEESVQECTSNVP